MGYVEQAKESEQLYKVRDALIASQTTLIRTYGTDGEFGNDNGSKNGNKKLTKEQVEIIKNDTGSCRAKAKKYNLSVGTISKIMNDKY